jgi:uncharacterized membrane protein HdeD (DUF308 family)
MEVAMATPVPLETPPVLSGVHWWALAIRGIVAIVFAVLTFVIPGLTLALLVLVFGGYAVVDGIFALISAVRAAHGHRRWGAFLVEGIVGIVAGLIALCVPVVTLFFFIYILAAWGIITGIFEIAAAMRLRRQVANEWLLVLTGIVSIIFGIVVFWAPAVGALTIAWWVGGYAFIFGVLLLALAVRLRKLHLTTLPKVA